MNLTPMSYRDYVWPRNPEALRTERARNVTEFKIPGETGAVQENGTAPRKVTGSGRFTGDGAAEEFSRLSAVFAAGGSGALRLPGEAPFRAVFARLVTKGLPRLGCVAYEFTFLEDAGGASGETKGAAVAAEGETLWDVANRCGASVDALLSANPQIEWPNALRAGEKVAVP